MKTTYETVVLGYGNHAAIEIPKKNLAEIGGNKRAPLKVTVKHHTYQSTATVMDGKCLVVFPTRDRVASGVASGDKVTVTLQLDAGYREVEMPGALSVALESENLTDEFNSLVYSKRKEHARSVAEAKAEETRQRRIAKVLDSLKG
jgi:hypothetical protein